MGTRYLLDSNTVIDYIAGLHPDEALKWLNQVVDEEINVSVITKIEVLSYNPDKEDNYQILVEFFESAAVFDLTEDIVERTIYLRQKQKIKLPDAVIAATALVNDMKLISRNTKDFKNIKRLEIVDPYKI
ncbi:MAG TPA: type II toxin-antitoxin system VapC family toxin [Mariniphaga anaerophila]|uniref:Type II toxin-antitoxin system VapC family toxin n=1 Tax=Mariniphaga anaerophila TaxID=1484053 RepID=A0A831LVA6_9BACT|nr:type II toxin-antitoxin system VapC family toxin [Mariniphaga anaerophila]